MKYTTDPALEESIYKDGVIEPLLLNMLRQVLVGNRRWKAAVKVGLTDVPFTVHCLGIRSPGQEFVRKVSNHRYPQWIEQANEIRAMIYSNAHRKKTDCENKREGAWLLMIADALNAQPTAAGDGADFLHSRVITKRKEARRALIDNEQAQQLIREKGEQFAFEEAVRHGWLPTMPPRFARFVFDA